MTTHACTGTGNTECIDNIDLITKMYSNRGFTISMYNGDNTFNMLTDHIGRGNLNIVGREDHVGVIERSIRTLKERTRCMCHQLPYKGYTKLMIIEMVIGETKLLNAFPNKDGIDHDLSPDAIILGTPKLDYNNIKLPFGSYVNLYDGTDNTMNSRTVGAITLRASNEHGSYYFISLRSDRRLKSSQWTELPIIDEIIDRVDNMSKQELQRPNTTTDEIVFE